MSIAIVCEDVDRDSKHSLLVSRDEAEQIAAIDPAIASTVALRGNKARIDVHSDGTSDIWELAPGGQSHWTVNTQLLIDTTQAALDDPDSD